MSVQSIERAFALLRALATAPYGVTELAESGVNLVARPWVKAEDYWQTKCDLTEKIKNGFDERGFTIPYPTQEIHVRQPAGSA